MTPSASGLFHLWAVVPLILLPVLGMAQQPRELKVGVYANEPKVFVDTAGKPAGIFVDLLNSIAAQENWKLHYQPCEWQDCMAALQAGTLDLMPDVAMTPERDAVLDFHSVPILHSWSQVYRRSGVNIHSLFDLQGKRVAVLKGSVQSSQFAAMMNGFGIEFTPVHVLSLQEAFALVQQGAADAAIANQRFGNFQAERYGLMESGIVFQPSVLYFATASGRHPDVLAAIDRHAAAWQKGVDPTFARVLQRWSGPDATVVARVPAWVGWGLAVLAAFSLLAGGAVLVLRRKVYERTAHLAASEQKLNTILNSVGAFIYIKGVDHCYQYANRHVLELYGCGPDGVLGKDDRQFFDADTARQLYENDRRVLELGETVETQEVITPLRDGVRRFYLSVKIPLRKPDGSIHGLCGISTDMTEHRLAQEALQIAATVFESQEGMIVTDPDKKVLKANQSFARITGYTTDELVGQTPALWRSGRQSEEFYAELWRTVSQKGEWQGELWNRRKSGEVYPAWVTITAVHSADGAISHYVSTQIDISQRKAAEEEIRLLAYYDPLTGLPNRRLMVDQLRRSLAVHARSGTGGALMFVDLDNFKDLNDTQGHEVGDQLLRQVAERLNGCLRQGDMVARLGGDEFVLLLEGLSDSTQKAASQAELVGRAVLQVLSQGYALGHHMHHCSCSIGVALYPNEPVGVEEMLKRGDMAMYQAKAAGRNTLRFFDPRTQAAITARAALESGLRDALRKGEFVLYYQAQVNESSAIVGAEVLVRWQHPERGMISPAEFIAVAETSGLIVPLGAWILRAACLQLVEWAASEATAHWSLAVNVSARQFRHPHFVDEVLSIVAETGVSPQLLKLELTESMLLDDIEDTIARMDTLRKAGLRFSLDDFGTGYSSLSYLKRLPLDQLKIDRTFVRDLLTDPNDAAIARTIVALAYSLDLSVIAEGVETEAQRVMLQNLGCHDWQGYLFGRPGPAAELRPAGVSL